MQRTLILGLVLAASATLGLPTAVAGNAWGTDEEPDWNDWQGDDDEGRGNDPGRHDGSHGGGHAWGKDANADCKDWQGDDNEGYGNDPGKKDAPCP